MSKLQFTRDAVRVVTVIIMVAIVAIATADGFAQSYSGLYEWAKLHKLSGWKADTFPLLVDLFILVGELGLFLLALDGFRLRKSFLAWTDVAFPAAVAIAGWGVSLWFNVNHIPNATTEDKVTAGVPPVAAMVGLFIMLRTVHRYMAQLEDASKSSTELIQVPEPADRPEIVTATAGEPIKEGQLVEWTRTPLSGPDGAVVVPAWQPSGTVADEPETDAQPQPEPTPESAPSNGRTSYGKGPGHPKWDEGVKIYRESLQGPGKPLSQRDLAAALDMRNRTLAANIIKHVKGEIESGSVNGVPTATESATPEESAS